MTAFISGGHVELVVRRAKMIQRSVHMRLRSMRSPGNETSEKHNGEEECGKN